MKKIIPFALYALEVIRMTCLVFLFWILSWFGNEILFNTFCLFLGAGIPFYLSPQIKRKAIKPFGWKPFYFMCLAFLLGVFLFVITQNEHSEISNYLTSLFVGFLWGGIQVRLDSFFERVDSRGDRRYFAVGMGLIIGSVLAYLVLNFPPLKKSYEWVFYCLGSGFLILISCLYLWGEELFSPQEASRSLLSDKRWKKKPVFGKQWLVYGAGNALLLWTPYLAYQSGWVFDNESFKLFWILPIFSLSAVPLFYKVSLRLDNYLIPVAGLLLSVICFVMGLASRALISSPLENLTYVWMALLGLSWAMGVHWKFGRKLSMREWGLCRAIQAVNLILFFKVFIPSLT